eukprot:4067848-Alexandrium_andersonii.AAC.1
MDIGIECDLEQPKDSESWKVKDLRELRDQMYETNICGCAYGLKCEKTGELIKKPWRIISTDPLLPAKVNKWCSNVKGSLHCHRHRPLEGGDVVARSAAYPPALCREWVKVILGDHTASDEGGQ